MRENGDWQCITTLDPSGDGVNGGESTIRPAFKGHHISAHWGFEKKFKNEQHKNCPNQNILGHILCMLTITVCFDIDF